MSKPRVYSTYPKFLHSVPLTPILYGKYYVPRTNYYLLTYMKMVSFK